MERSAPRVAWVIDDLGHGGAQRQLYLTVRALSGDVDARVVVLSGRVDPYAARLRALGVPVDVIARRSHLEIARVRALVRTLRASRVQVVHGLLDASNAYAFLAGRALRLPVVLSLRSDRLHVTGARAAALRWMLRRAEAVTVNSEAGHDHLLGALRVPGARVHRVPNIVLPPPSPGGSARTAGSVGCVGRLVAVKRFEAVIEAFPEVRRAVPGASLVVVGDGPCRARLEAAAARTGLGAAVKFTGAVEDAAERIAGLSCLVVASEHEGLANAALEAMAAGTPVVTVPAGDLPRLVTPGVTGVIARDGSPPSLAAAIVEVLRTPALAESAAREGPRVVGEKFPVETARRVLVDLYRHLME